MSSVSGNAFIYLFIFNLDNDELLLQGFPIWELLPEAHVDGVLRRPALVLLEPPEL